MINIVKADCPKKKFFLFCKKSPEPFSFKPDGAPKNEPYVEYVGMSSTTRLNSAIGKSDMCFGASLYSIVVTS